MSMGWIKMMRNERELFPLSDPKYSRFEAWLDLIGLANWESKKWGNLEIKRGSFATSYDGLATRWKWSKWAVIRYLKALKKALRIRYVTAPGPHRNCTVIDVLDYEAYQGVSDPEQINPLRASTLSAHLAAQQPQPTKEEELIIRNKISNMKEITKRKQCASVPSLIEDPNLKSWLDYRKQINKPLKPKTIEALIDKFRIDPVGMKAQVENSITNGYQGLFPPKPTNGYKPHTAASTTEKNFEYLRSTQNEPIDLERLFNVFSDCEEESNINSRIGGGLVSSPRKLIG